MEKKRENASKNKFPDNTKQCLSQPSTVVNAYFEAKNFIEFYHVMQDNFSEITGIYKNMIYINCRLLFYHEML